MNRQKEYTEEGRYTPISKSEGGSSKEYYKAVWVIGEETSTKVNLKTDDIDGLGTVYTNDDTVYDGNPISVTRDGEAGPETLMDAGIVVNAKAGSALYVDEFDGGEGIYPLYIQVARVD